MMSAARTQIVGIGSDWGDDRLGLVVAEQLAARAPACDVRQLRSPLDLLDCASEVRRLHIIDACCGAGPAGTVVRRAWAGEEASPETFLGAHDCDLLSALQLLTRLHPLPREVILWGVEAAPVDPRHALLAPLSPAVASAADALIDQIVAELAAASSAEMERADYA